MGAWGGYRNGRIPLAALEHVGRGAINGEPQYLHPAVAAAWRALVADVRAHSGVTLAITEGFRPLALQQHYWNTLPYPFAATPGTSTHGWAMAVDMANYARVDKPLLRRLAQARGFSFATGDRVKEPWHIEFIGSLTTAALNVTPIVAEEEGFMYTVMNTATGGVYTTAAGFIKHHPDEPEAELARNVTSSTDKYIELNQVDFNRWLVSCGVDPSIVAPNRFVFNPETSRHENGGTWSWGRATYARVAAESTAAVIAKAVVASLPESAAGGLSLADITNAVKAAIPTAEQNGAAARAAIVK